MYLMSLQFVLLDHKQEDQVNVQWIPSDSNMGLQFQ